MYVLYDPHQEGRRGTADSRLQIVIRIWWIVEWHGFYRHCLQPPSFYATCIDKLPFWLNLLLWTAIRITSLSCGLPTILGAHNLFLVTFVGSNLRVLLPVFHVCVLNDGLTVSLLQKFISQYIARLIVIWWTGTSLLKLAKLTKRHVFDPSGVVVALGMDIGVSCWWLKIASRNNPINIIHH